ncbi:MAG: hypothetical protein IIA00_04375, partial [Proteobacteria bacterium]|nr:hypothetical protein [Pseudomonadota bacterium]
MADVLSTIAPPAAEYCVEACTFVGMGLQILGTCGPAPDPDGRPWFICVSGAYGSLDSVKAVVTHECAHAWSLPEPSPTSTPWSAGEMRAYKDIQKMYFMDTGDLPPHFDGKEEHCPYINLGYISTVLTDPFAKQNPNAFLFHQGMYHSTHIRNPNGIKAINPSFWEEWKRAG